MENNSDLCGSSSTAIHAVAGWGEELPRLVASIGLPRFEIELVGFLNQFCGADHIHVFQLTHGQPQVTTSLSSDGTNSAAFQTKVYLDNKFWRKDPSMMEAGHRASEIPMLFSLDIATATAELRAFYRAMRLRERTMICGRDAAGILGLSMMRAERRAPLTSDALNGLRRVIDLAFTALVKHRSICLERMRLSSALASLPEIESRLLSAPKRLSRREAEVGARLLYGLSATSVARDLTIGRETVITHRKRLYERLSISTYQELLLWYLALFSIEG